MKLTNSRSLRFIALAAAIQFAVFGCSQTNPEDYIQKAQAHYKKGELQAASLQLSNALAQAPNNVDARWLMAQVALQSGDAARAEKDVRHAIQFGLPRATGQLTLVKALMLQGAVDKALAETSLIPDDAPPSERAMLLGLRGQALLLKGQASDARPVLEKALEIDAKATTALVGMAVTHLAASQYEEAKSWIDKALETDSSSAEVWSTLGELELSRGNAEQAEKAYDRAVEFRKQPSLDRARRALARLQLKKYEEAVADINALKQRGWKNHWYVNYVQGLIDFQQKKYSEAGTAFEASYAADPSFLPNRMYLATTRFLQGQTEQALEHAKALYSSTPRSSSARELLGAIQINRSEYSAARKMLQSSLASAPQDKATLRMLSTLSMLDGDERGAVEYAQKLATLDPDSDEAQHMLMAAKLVAGQDFDRIVSNSSSAGADDYERSLLLALNDFRKGRIAVALEQARKIHQAHADKVDPINLIAACYLAAGKWDLAKDALLKVLALQPDEPSAARNLAILQLREGKQAEAKSTLQSLLKQHPGDEPGAMMLADMAVKAGDAASVISILEPVVKDNPGALAAAERLAAEQFAVGNLSRVLAITSGRSDSQLKSAPKLLELRGKAQMLSGDVTGARNTFEQWSRLMPSSAAPHFLLAETLSRKGNLENARKELRTAIELDPKFTPARIGEVKMLVHAGEMDKAQKALVRLRGDFGERAEILGIEGWFALGTGNPALAEARLSAALHKHPDAELTVLLARSMLLQQKHDEGFRVLNKWLEDHPKDVGVLMELAGDYLALERSDEAISTYAKVLDILPNHVPALNNIAWLYSDRNPAKAMEYAQRAQNLSPADPDVLDTVGMMTLKNGDRPRAYNLIREAAQRAPGRPEIQMHLASILILQGEHREAREVLERVAKNFPNSTQANEARRLIGTLAKN